MGSFLEIIKTNPAQCIILILLIATYLVYKIWQIKKQGLKPIIIDFIIKAEDSFNYGENAEKMNFVIDRIIALIPLPFSVFITRDMVRKLIQNVFDEIKKTLDYQNEEKF